jgi:hypothetical protein
MKFMAGVLGLGLAVLAAPAAAQQVPAQQAPAPGRAEGAEARIERALEESGVVPAAEALGAAVGPELERAVADLATSLGAVLARVASDPELRSSALRAARGMVDVAEVTVVEQASLLQEVLRAAAEHLETLSAGRRQRD